MKRSIHAAGICDCCEPPSLEEKPYHPDDDAILYISVDEYVDRLRGSYVSPQTRGVCGRIAAWPASHAASGGAA